MKSVVLLSGGLDSAANLAFCRLRDEPVLALTFNYGQRAVSREIGAARALCAHYGVAHEVVELSFFQKLGGSSLTDTAQDVPHLKISELDTLSVIEQTAKSVWVPNRNGVLLNVGAAYAERMGAKRVVVGFNREEAMTFPDNSNEFLGAATRAFSFSTANHVQVFSYTVEMSKKEIVRELMRVDSKFPREKVWSCYHGGVKICGECESCRRSERAWEGV